MRKAYVVRAASIPSLVLPNQWGEWAPQTGRRTAIRVKLTTYKPTRPVTLICWSREMSTTVSLAMRLNQRYAAYSL